MPSWLVILRNLLLRIRNPQPKPGYYLRHILNWQLTECIPPKVQMFTQVPFHKKIFIVTNLYRVSQEERTKLREGVPYVKLYRYNPKHLCPKLNGYWDNGQIKLLTSFGSTNDSCQLVSVISICSPVRHTNCWRSPEMHIPAYVRQAGRQAGWRHRSAFQCDV